MDYEPKQRWHCTHCDPDGREDQWHDIIARDDDENGYSSIKTKCCRCGRETWR